MSYDPPCGFGGQTTSNPLTISTPTVLSASMSASLARKFTAGPFMSYSYGPLQLGNITSNDSLATLPSDLFMMLARTPCH